MDERIYNKKETRNRTKKTIKLLHEMLILFFKAEVFGALPVTALVFPAISYDGYFGL